jgi:hypothetical protein
VILLFAVFEIADASVTVFACLSIFEKEMFQTNIHFCVGSAFRRTFAESG